MRLSRIIQIVVILSLIALGYYFNSGTVQIFGVPNDSKVKMFTFATYACWFGALLFMVIINILNRKEKK